MLPIQRSGSACFRCAYRARLLSLQQLRTHSVTAPLYRSVGKQSRRKNDGADKYRGRSSGGRGGFKDTEQFAGALAARLRALKKELKNASTTEQLLATRKSDGPDQGNDRNVFETVWHDFMKNISSISLSRRVSREQLRENGVGTIQNDLESAYKTRNVAGLDDRIKYWFYTTLISEFADDNVRNQKALADLRYPSEWYPATRVLHRKVHLHVGPTNSGKTYTALQRLEQAKSGAYGGPLRLLAHEVYTRMNAKGKSCALITGEERRMPEGSDENTGKLMACTVEMLPLNKQFDVVVIDEIQMIGNADRGWAWTQALLGVKADEVHLCGEERTVPLIKEICASIGDTLEIHKYKRLSPLKMDRSSLDGDLSKLQKGDCIVSFSVMGIHALRRQIEKETGKKVAIVYGSLPPETRAQQARLFNDQDNEYDFLVASDAVGMGLNLAIKRVIFETTIKFDGVRRKALPIADIKQIAGRAGRFRTAAQATETPLAEQDLAVAKGDAPARKAPKASADSLGLVTTLESADYPVVERAMQGEPEPITSAGLSPPDSILERFASYFPQGTPFSFLLIRLHELSQTHTRYHLCGLKDQTWIADLIEPIQNLTITDRNIITSAPASKTDNDLWKELMPAFARCIANQAGGNITEIQELPLETLELDVVASKEYLRDLERLHKGIVTYLWLGYRFAGIFAQRGLALHVKALVEQKIEIVLQQVSATENAAYKAQLQKERMQILQDFLAQKPEGANDKQAFPEGYDGDLDDQTSLIGGGDRYGGEQEEELEEVAEETEETEETEVTEETEETEDELEVEEQPVRRPAPKFL